MAQGLSEILQWKEPIPQGLLRAQVRACLLGVSLLLLMVGVVVGCAP